MNVGKVKCAVVSTQEPWDFSLEENLIHIHPAIILQQIIFLTFSKALD